MTWVLLALLGCGQHTVPAAALSVLEVIADPGNFPSRTRRLVEAGESLKRRQVLKTPFLSSFFRSKREGEWEGEYEKFAAMLLSLCLDL